MPLCTRDPGKNHDTSWSYDESDCNGDRPAQEICRWVLKIRCPCQFINLSREGGSCVSNNWCPRLSCRAPGDPVCPLNGSTLISLKFNSPFTLDIQLHFHLYLCPDCQDLWERVHWVQRDQPQFWDAGHRESRAGGGLSQSLGGCEERPSKSARQLKLEDGGQQNFLSSRIVVFGHVAHGGPGGGLAFSQVWWFLLQPTGICSNLLSFHFGYFGPMCTLPKSAWICFYLHVISSVSDKYFALTVVTLFININVFYSLLFLVASVI